MSEIDSFLDDNLPAAGGDSSIDSFLGTEPKKSSATRRVLGDGGISLLKGAIAVPEAAVGLADIATGGAAGKAAEGLGFRPKQAKQILDSYLTPEQQAANRAVQQADGFGETIGAMVENPSTIAHTVAESLPLMGAGGVVGRGITALAPKVAPWAAGAVGEGAVGAGAAAEGMRQQTEDGLLTPEQQAAALGSGLGTGAIGAAGGRLAQKLGITDVDTALAGGAAQQSTKGLASRVAGGAVVEGALQEMPQSMQEQAWQNYGLGKPLDEGVGAAGAMGLATGGLIGAGAGALSGPAPDLVQPMPTAENPVPAPVPRPNPNNGPLSNAASRLPASAGPTPAPVLDTDRIGQATGLSAPPLLDAARIAQQVDLNAPMPPDWNANAPAVDPQQLGRELFARAGSPVDWQNAPPVLDAGQIDQRLGAPKAVRQPAAQQADVAEERALNTSFKKRNAAEKALAKLGAPDEYKVVQEGGAWRVVNKTAAELLGEPAGTESPGDALKRQELDAREAAKQARLKGDNAEGRRQREIALQARAQRQELGGTPITGRQQQRLDDAGARVRDDQQAEQEQQLRGELAYLEQQARASGGWTPALSKERARVRKALEPFEPKEPAAPSELPEVAPQAAQPAAEPASQMAVKDAAPAAPAAQAEMPSADQVPVKWFASRQKAEAHIAKKKLGDTHQVVQNGNKYEVRPLEQQQVEPTAPAAASSIDAAAHEAATSPQNDLPEPTQAQKEAGNYAKGHVSVQGLDITVENPRGSERSGKRPDGSEWRHAMSDHYGYIKRTEGADGEQVDAYIGPNPDSEQVFVVDQLDQQSGGFDEHKVMLGFNDEAAAIAAYRSNFDADWKVGPVRAMPMAEFKAWLKDGDTAKPAAEQQPAKAESTPAAAQPKPPTNWRGNYIQAQRYAKSLGLPVDKGKKLADVLAAIDAHLGGQNRAGEPAESAPSSVAMSKWPGGRSSTITLPQQQAEPAAKPVTVKKEPGITTIVIDPSAGRQPPAPTRGNRPSPPAAQDTGIAGEDSPEARASLRALLDNPGAARVSGVLTNDQDRQGNRIPDWTPVANGFEARQYIKNGAAIQEIRSPSGAIARRGMDPDGEPFGELEATASLDAMLSGEAMQEFEQYFAGRAAVAGGNARQEQQAPAALPAPEPQAAPAPEAKPADDRFAGNTIFTADKVAVARALLKAKMGQLNSGFDPELATAGMTIAGGYIESGIRDFREYARLMVEDFGERIKPYMLGFWENVRHYPGLDTEGMTSYEDSLRLHQELNTALPAEEAPALGAEVKAPAARAKKGKGPDRALIQDFGVEHIDGYGDGTREIGNDVKDAFLKDAAGYLKEVAKLLEKAGFVPHQDAKGRDTKPVSVNEAGPAVSGDVYLSMRTAHVSASVQIGGSSLIGVVPTTKSGISVMYRVSRKADDRGAGGGTNRWAPVDLTADELATMILREANGLQPALSRQPLENTADETDTARREVGQGDPAGAPAPAGGRGRAPQPGDSPADTGDLGAGQPADVGAAGQAGDSGRAGVRVPGADVAGGGSVPQGRPTDDRRPRAGGTGSPDAGAGGDRAAGAADAPGRRGGDAAAGSRQAPAQEVAPQTSPAATGVQAQDLHIANPLEVVGGTPVQRFNRNRQSLELLQTLEEEGRQATPEEQRILAGYIGWGSFGQELFQGSWERPVYKDEGIWKERGEWLRETLGESAWKSAQRSITNAHYTDPPTVMAMWDMVRRMGFSGGKVLEPSMGTGNFFSMMPADLKARSQLTGIELDETTGAIAKQLFPQSNVRVMGYQDSKTPDGFYDLIIGNWPFENTPIADRRYNKLNPMLHDYFFLKTMDQVRPGGIVIGITSAGSMDKQSTAIRRELARKAELVGSIRLPSGAFEEYAGTKVVTDIVILRKRPERLMAVPQDATWVETGEFKTPSGESVRVNQYYLDNPQHIIGQLDYGHGTTTFRAGMIVHRPENMAERLRQAVELVPESAFQPREQVDRLTYYANETGERHGALAVVNDRLMVAMGDQLVMANEKVAYAIKDAKKTAAREQELRAAVDLRRRHTALVDAERAGHDGEAARKALRDGYQAFVKAHGPLRESFALGYFRKLDDPFYAELAALENDDGGPAAVMQRSTTRSRRTIDSPSVRDAYVLARNQSVNPSLEEVARLAGKSPDEVKAELLDSGAVFEAPNGDIVPSDIYLSGNVRVKLREAQAALEEGNAGMSANIAALQDVLPEDVPYFNIETKLGATWVPPEAYAEYIAHMLARPDAKGITVSFQSGRWKVRLAGGMNALPEASTNYGTGAVPFNRLAQAAMSNQTLRLTVKDKDGNDVYSAERSEEANGRIAKIREEFATWLWSDPSRRVDLEREYNEARNAWATPKYDGSFLTFEGMALSLGKGVFNLRQHQVNAIWRAIVNRRSINAHEVGTGKTFTMGGIAVESRRYGIARKPVILAHNANSASVAKEIRMMYPAARVLYIDNLDKNNRAIRLRQIANDDWDAIVIPHSMIDKLALREETLMKMAEDDIRALEIEFFDAAREDGAHVDEFRFDFDDDDEIAKVRSVTAKELAKARKRIVENIKKQAQQSSKEDAVSFEDLGIDMILVDEAHEFKKPPIVTRMQMKGLNTQVSDRSIALQFLTRYVRQMNNGGNVHTFTGTPITNTITEIYHQMRYVMEAEMDSASVADWDGWFGSFATEVQDVELAASGDYEMVTRLAGFVNVPELRQMVGQYMDTVFADDMPEMKPRKTASGKTAADELTEAERAELLNGRTEGAQDRPYKKVINASADMTGEQMGVFNQLQQYARDWRSAGGKQRRTWMHQGDPRSPIITEGIANKASFDVRLLDEGLAGQEGQTQDDPESKASRAVRNVLEIYNSHPQAGQVIFAEMGFNKSTSRSGRDANGEKYKYTAKVFATVHDIVERLVQGGIPREQIAIVDGKTGKDKRRQIAEAMNESRIRVVIGSTDTLGVGVNMQRNLRAMHHLDAPYMPGELEQRNGRGLRQGNQWNTVLEFRYMTDRLDGRRWQILAVKQRFINAFMKASGNTRVIEGEAAADEQSDILESFSEAAGDPRVLQRVKLQKKQEGLQRKERMYSQGIADMRRQVRYSQEEADKLTREIEQDQRDGVLESIAGLIAAQQQSFAAVIDNKAYDSRKDAVAALQDYIESNLRVGDKARTIGTYGGQPLSVEWLGFADAPTTTIKAFGRSFGGKGIAGAEAKMRNFPKLVEDTIAERDAALATIANMRQAMQQPFGQAADLERIGKQLADLEKDLAINPVPPPAWLRQGAPMDSEVFRKGKPYVVTGHRYGKDGWFVIAEDDKGTTMMPYMEATDSVGMPLYDEREFVPPTVVEQPSKAVAGDDVPAFARRDGSNRRGLPVEVVQATVDDFLSKYRGADNVQVRVLPSQAGFPGYNAERDAGATLFAQYDSRRDTLYLNAGAFRSANEVREALQEDLLVHKGLGFFSPLDRQRLYRQIQKGVHENPALKELWDQTVADYEPVAKLAKLSEEQANRLYAEEMLGTLAQRKINWLSKGWNRLLLAFHALAVKIGWAKPQATTADMIAVVHRIAAAFERGRRAQQRDFSADIRADNRSASGGSSPHYRLTGNANGIPLISAKSIAKKVAKATGLHINVVNSEAELPAGLREEIELAGASGRVAGVYYNGTPFLVAANLRDTKHAISVALHEVVGHGGVRAVLGSQVDRIMVEIFRDMPDATRSALERRYAGQLAGLTQAQAQGVIAEEYIAHLAETDPRNGIIARLVALVRQWLRNTFGEKMAMRWTRGDIVQLLAEARRAVSPDGGGGGVTRYRQEAAAPADYEPLPVPEVGEEIGGDDMADFARAMYRSQGTQSMFFRNWFGNSKMRRPDGTPVAFYHRSFDPRDRFDDTRLGGNTGTATAHFGHYFAARDVGNVERYGPLVERFFVKMERPKVVTMAQFEAMGDWSADRVKAYRERLQQQGHDGLWIQGLNWAVAFDGKNVKAVANRGTFDDTGATRFSLLDFAPEWLGGRAPFPLERRDVARSLRGKLADLKPAMLGTLPLSYLRDFAPRTMTALDSYMDQKRAMDADRNELHSRYDAIAQRWTKLRWTDRKAERALSDLMHAATLAGIDPSKPFGAHPDQQPEYDRLRAQYEALPEGHRAMFGEARDAYRAQVQTLEQVIEDNIRKSAEYAKKRARRDRDADIEQARDELAGDELDEAIEKAEQRYARRVASAEQGNSAKLLLLRKRFESMRVDEPYFPLKRYGDYFVALRDGNTLVSFGMYESAADMEAAAADLRRTYPGLSVKVGRKSAKQELAGAVDPAFVSDLQELVARLPNSQEVGDQIWQMYLDTLPDYSMRKGFIHRKKTPGFERDALRGFASSMFHSSYQIARLKHSLEMNELVEQVEEQAKEATDPVDAMTIANELRKRHEWVMAPKGGKIAQRITSAAFVYQLGLTPAAALVNTSQTWMMGIPVLGTRFGSEAKAMAALGKASKDFVKGRGQLDKTLQGDEAKAFAEFTRMGLIDKTQAHDLAGVGETGVEYNPIRHKVMGYISWAFHNAERYNREVTSMAAYRMGRESGLDHEAAIKEAADLTWTTHFDYSSGNRPRYLQNDTAKVLFVFRQHSINMLSRLTIDLKDAMKGESPAVKAAAKRRLAGMFGMFALMAGAMGVPGMQALLALLDLFDDDDDPWSAEDKIRRTLAETLGPDVSKVLLGGVPGAALDLSLTERLGMGSLWFWSSNRELEGQDAYYYWMEQMLGAAPAMVGNAFTGMKLIGEGQVWRGIETMMPKAIKDVMRSGRYTEEGVQTLAGDAIVSDVSTWNVIAQAMGFTPAHIAEQYDRNSALKNAEQHVLTERRSLLNRLAMATKAGDPEARQGMMERIGDFNRRYPTVAITGKTILLSMKARAQRDERTEGGLALDKRLEFLRDDL